MHPDDKKGFYNRWWRITHFYKIKTKEAGESRRLKLNPIQAVLAKYVDFWNFILVLKARQQGVSTFFLAWHLDWTLKLSGVNETAVAVLADSALADFGSTVVALRKFGQRAALDKKKLNDKIVEGIIQGSSVYRTERQLLDGLKKSGIVTFKSKNGFGRRIRPESYANTLVRSQSIAAYANGARMQMLGMGDGLRKSRSYAPTSTAPMCATSGRKRSTST